MYKSMWNPPNEYSRKTEWKDYEDKALIICWGLTSIDEICEAFMCTPSCVVFRARILGLVPYDFEYLTAEYIEWIVRSLKIGKDHVEIAYRFGLPDENLKYIKPNFEALVETSREIQDYYAKQNDDQLSLFGDE